MAVTVRIPTVLRPHAGGQAQVTSDGKTVGEVFADITGRFPAITPNLLGDDGELHRFVNVYVNDEDVRYLEQMNTTLSEGDEVAILPAVAGGASA